jgi:predicted phage terminase large subunit-like protein
LRRRIEADCASFPVDKKTSTARRERAAKDFHFFRTTYFPHYTRDSKGRQTGDSALHVWLDTALPAAVDAPEGRKLAVAAPRGEAKTTFVSLFFALWCLVTGRKQYLVLIADAFEQAASFLEAVKAELESNPRLSADWPEHCGVGRVWNVGTIVTAKNVKLQAFGAGKRMRGLRHGPCRPDLALLDDLENDENVRKPEQRDKLETWLLRAVLSLGPADGSMDVVYVGTILHYDSVLARTLKKPQWQSVIFKGVVRMPDRMDLWDNWEVLLKVGGPGRAAAFYAKNEKAMCKGAKVSWPSVRPLYTLMLKRAEDRAAFDAEQQNDPLAADAAPFAECIHYWIELPQGLLLFGACDPSLGKAGQGRDPSALLIGGMDRANMRLYVLEALIRKRHPDRIIQDMIALQRQYNCLLWAVETVQFQAFFADVLVREAASQGVPIPVMPVINSSDKALRIESLQPYCRQGRILVRQEHGALVDQLRHFPMADHDDGPDALEMLWRCATQGFVNLRDAYVRVPQSYSGISGIVGTDFDDDDGWNDPGRGWN